MGKPRHLSERGDMDCKLTRPNKFLEGMSYRVRSSQTLGALNLLKEQENDTRV